MHLTSKLDHDNALCLDENYSSISNDSPSCPNYCPDKSLNSRPPLLAIGVHMEVDNPQQALQSLLSAVFEDNPDLKQRIDNLDTLSVSDAVRERCSLEKEFPKSVERVLTAPQHRSLEPYISELAEFNYKDTGESLAEFISPLVLSHAIDSPWILEVERMHSFRLRCQSKAGKSPREALFIPSTHNEEDPFAYDDLLPRDHADPAVPVRQSKTVVLPRPSMLPAQLNSAHNFHGDPGFENDLSFQLDCLLGVAGTNQLDPEALQKVDYTDPRVHETVLRGFRSHVSFERRVESKVGISKGERKIRAVIFSNRDSLDDHEVFLRITKVMDTLETAILLCQKKGICLFGIPFFTRHSLVPRSAESEHLSLTLVAISTVERFFTGFRSLKGFYMRSRETVAPVAVLAAASLGIWGLAITAGLGLAALPLIGIGAGFAATGASEWPESKERHRSFEIVVEMVADILRACGIKTGLRFPPTKEGFSRLLHYSSLAVQCLSLGIQLSARGLTLPLDSALLEHNVDEFVLQGITAEPAVYVIEQEITCLGGILPSHRVPVFGARRHSVSDSVDVVTSVRDLLSVWGPGAVEFTETPPEGNSQPWRIIRINIGGGVLFPVENQGWSSVYRWHWTDGNGTGSQKATMDSYFAVDLNTKIRVGGFGSDVVTTSSTSTVTRAVLPLARRPNATPPGTFMAIGPSSINPACRFSTWTADATRRRYMSHHLRDIGTHRPFTAFAGYDVGPQIGSYLLLQLMRKYERRPGTTLKDTILQKWDGMPQFLRGLDKPCGLFVSSCTKVIARARLRDLIAFAGPLVLPEAFPLLLGQGQEDSIASWVHALRGSEDLYDWARNQRTDQGNGLASADGSAKVKDLILGVLRILEPTGITASGLLSTAWVSPHEVINVVSSRCRRGSWLALLADSEFSATFACVTPLCLNTRDRRCLSETSSPWHCSFESGLEDFTLSTRISQYADLPSGNTSEAYNGVELEVGQSYLINTQDFETAAKLLEVDETDEPFYVFEVKKAALVTVFVKRLYMKGRGRFIRESNDENSRPCLIIGNN
ncbi:hypothetical protein SAPIO_CDS1622 [Scedosporium apiospermum]|uniref:Uncharacterized protein n=1 Tax=Pseudallescheria apiosperma TaxID=563466 RepID=A0A084GEP5_PSEDA|nr:uncharacterized protein SAPIO_CDS1622 [Scedosporium apiospermum]KEZ45807.1 hypothetical protein SAPIO_CDS1622 [Scedosporium apiospermum]